MKEKELTTKVMKELREFCANNSIPFFYHKIADVPMSFVGRDNKFRFNPTKFVDVFGCLSGKGFALEFKLHQGPGGFAFDHVRDNQIESLVDFENAGGISRLVIAQIYEASRFSEKQLLMDNVQPHEIIRGKVCRIYILTPEIWNGWKSLSDKKSERLSTLLGSYVVNKQKVGRSAPWDCTTFLNLLEIDDAQNGVNPDPSNHSELAEPSQISPTIENRCSDMGDTD